MLQNVKEQIAQIEEKETSMSKQSLELQHKIEKYEDVVKTNQVKIKHWKKQVRWFSVFFLFFFITFTLVLSLCKISSFFLSTILSFLFFPVAFFAFYIPFLFHLAKSITRSTSSWPQH